MIDGSRLVAEVTQDPRRVVQAQRLRCRVLTEDLGARTSRTGIDEDRYDSFCEHLVVRDTASEVTVATYRILAPERADRAGGYHTAQLFDLQPLDVLRGRMVEVGRACIHPQYRSSAVTLLMWSTLARYLINGGHDYVVGSVGVSLTDGGDVAASLYRRARECSMSPEDYRVAPRCSLPLESLRETLDVPPPAMLRAYLTLGAWICGEPAWDPEFDCADFPILMPLARMHPRYARGFIEKAA